MSKKKKHLIAKQTDKENIQSGQGFQVLAKPAGPLCNLACKYCFYLEKSSLFPDMEDYRIAENILETYIKKYIKEQPGEEVSFVWQGGEPTLMGIDFYKKAVTLQKKYNNGKIIKNSLQTNGILLNDEWCRFFREEGFLVGLSMDGPEDIHNRYRVDRGGNPTFNHVMRGLRFLRRNMVEFNILTCITGESGKRPLDIYRFFKKEGVNFIQFIPIVERSGSEILPFSVLPEDYGDFLIAVFREWIKNDVGKIFIMNFEWALGSWLKLPSVSCFYTQRCGRCLIMEHNGDIYSCDHFVYPEYRLGNIINGSPKDIVNSKRQTAFGAKKENLPQYCLECEVLFACRGECPKHRFSVTPSGEEGLNYLCEGYRKFFYHADQYMRAMGKLILNGIPVERIKEAFKGPLVIKT